MASPQDQVVHMATAHWVSRYLYTAVELKLADCLATGPQTAEEVAKTTATHAPSLYRFLRTLASMGFELAVFSNGTPAMIGNCLENSGLAGFFGQRISVDEVRVFKPSPAAYRHAAGRLSRPAGQVRLVTSNAFDSVGASAAGMRTAWVNRSGAPFDTIGAQPDLTVSALDRLPAELAG